MNRLLALTIALAACADNTDPVWQLDHDRIVAVRATPPHIASGQVATFDALIAHAGAPTDIELPIAANAAFAPAGLFTAVHSDRGTWSVVAPGAAELDAARAELGLDPGAPVPLDVTVQFATTAAGIELIARKTVWLGDAAANPALPEVLVAGAPPGSQLVVPADHDVSLELGIDATWTASWLTSCGTMHDVDEPLAFVHVLPDDPQTGELAVVARDPVGGVVWQVWPIRAE
jgi:hypothetical protein